MPAQHDIDSHLRRGELLPVYAIVSPEPVLVDEAVRALRGKVLGPAADFNRDELRAGEDPVERVLQAAGTLPMMAPRRWVHLAEVDKLKVKEHPALLRYLEAPSPTTVLCLSGKKIDGRTKLGVKLSKTKALFVLPPPKQRDLADWVMRRARKKGWQMGLAAAQLLADLIGTDLGALDMALGKLALYAGPAADGSVEIRAEDVEAAVAPTRLHSIFELTDAVGARDLPQATLLLRGALGGGERGLMVLAMITRQLRHVLRASLLRAQGMPPPQIARTIGVPPFLVDSLLRQGRRYSTVELCAALDAAARADVRLKSSRLGAGVVLDRLLVEIIGSHARVRQGAR